MAERTGGGPRDEAPVKVPIVVEKPSGVLASKLPQVQDEEFRKLTIPMDGKLVLSTDPSLIGKKNFQTLTNMMYRPGHIKSIGGMTKINTDALSGDFITKSAFQYVEILPDKTNRSHVLVQTSNADFTASSVQQHKALVPATGEFEATALWTDSAGAGLGRFSNAPDHAAVYCNGIDTLI